MSITALRECGDWHNKEWRQTWSTEQVVKRVIILSMKQYFFLKILAISTILYIENSEIDWIRESEGKLNGKGQRCPKMCALKRVRNNLNNQIKLTVNKS